MLHGWHAIEREMPSDRETERERERERRGQPQVIYTINTQTMPNNTHWTIHSDELSE